MLARRFCETLCQWMLLLAVAGCCCCSSPQSLTTPSLARPRAVACDREQCRCEMPAAYDYLESARRGEAAYARAERLHAEGHDSAVDYWAQAIAWMDEASRLAPSRCCRAESVQRSAAIRILSVGQSYGRLDPSSHLLINGSMRTFRIPVVHQGFAWHAHDFDRLLVFNPPSDAPGNVPGCGVPLVVLTPGEPPQQSRSSLCCKWLSPEPAPQMPRNRSCDSFIEPGTPFAATALLQIPITLFNECDGSDFGDGEWIVAEGGESVPQAALTFVNPLTIDPLDRSQQIAQSPAMPFSYFQQNSPYDPLSAFVNGNYGVDQARLQFFEPYQADKIPLLFVHGLLSDPTIFMEMADAVRADPELRNRYQIWAFRYPTGEAFVKSAATLRQELAIAFACGEGANSHYATGAVEPPERAVIVGHSMGGLVAKMQITDSGDRLWRSVANVPLPRLRGPPRLLAELQDSFFFQANPNIGRVVYIATPHRGSPLASRCIGRVGELLALTRSPEEQSYDALVAANPGAFRGEFAESFPSSVELLRPSSNLLQALAALRSSPLTTTHSIIGDRFWFPLTGRSDGVVPVSSALIREAESTAMVDATHNKIQQSIQTQQELVRILEQHLVEQR